MVPREAGLGGELWAQRQEAWDSTLAVTNSLRAPDLHLR